MKKILTLLLLLTFSFFLSPFPSTAQTWLWGQMGTGDAWAYSDASDNKGNAYLVGFFLIDDTIRFGNYTVIDSSTINGNNESFIVKLNHSGNVIWLKQTINVNSITGAVTGSPYNISMDGSGNVYLNGSFPDILEIGSVTLVNNFLSTWSFTTFIAKYDSNGNVLWAKEGKVLNDSSSIAGKGITSDVYGNSYITGSFVDTIQFGLDTIATPSLNLLYAFIVRYDSNGNAKWARQSTGNTRYGVTAYCVAADLFGNSIAAGAFADSATFGPYKLGSIPSSTVGDLFVTKYDSAGNVLWAKQAVIPNTNSGCKVWAVSTDKSGNIYVAGDYEHTITLDTYTITGTAYDNFFLAKLDPNGNTLWLKGSKGNGTNNFGVQKLSVDNRNHIYLSALGGGSGLNQIVFAGDTVSLTDTTRYDGVSLIYKIDSNGTVLCSSIILGGAFSNCIASDTSGKYVYFGGTTATEMVFGNDTINPFSFHANYGYNFFPFTARWEGCDSNIVTAIVPTKNNIEEVKVYPNPNNGNFTLEYYIGNATGAYLTLYNTMGEIVGKYSLKDSQGKMSISNTGLSNGIYIWKVYTEKELIKFGKVIIIK